MNVFFYFLGPWVVFWLGLPIFSSLLVFSWRFGWESCVFLKFLEKGKKKLKDEKLLEVNITISVWCFDIPTKMLIIMEKFIKDRCVLGLCVLERGGSLSKFHFQMVCRIYISNVITLNKLIKKNFKLGWCDNCSTRTSCALQTIEGSVGMHTYTSVSGYDLKDWREEHLQFCHRNDSFE
jgi:hypothetical protein